jgi:hypothetical protein
MKFPDRGLPILTPTEKVAALAECLREGWHEDAAGLPPLTRPDAPAPPPGAV